MKKENLKPVGSHIFHVFLAGPNCSAWPLLTEYEYVIVAHDKIVKSATSWIDPHADILEEWGERLEPIASRNPSFGGLSIEMRAYEYQFMMRGMHWQGKLNDAIKWLDDRGLHLLDRKPDKVKEAVPAQKARIEKLVAENLGSV